MTPPARPAHSAPPGAIDTVGTTGRWEVVPNAVNSVPREATLEIDIRWAGGPACGHGSGSACI